METKQKYLRDIRDAINGVETAMPGVAGESEATYLRDIAKAIRSSGIDPSIPKVTDADNGKVLKVVNGVWAKADDEGVLYGENAPAANVGKDGDVYVQYEIKENKTLKYSLDEPIVITDYSDRDQRDAACIFTGIMLEDGKKYLVEAGVDVVDSESYADTYGWTHVDGSSGVRTFGPDSPGMSPLLTSVTPPDCPGAHYIGEHNITIANAGSYALPPHVGELAIDFGIKTGVRTLLMYGKAGEYSRTVTYVNAYEVEYESSLTDIYLKVNGEWVKDNFGKDEEPEQPESISLLHLDEDFVNDQITDAKGITYSLMTGSTGISMTNETKKFGDKCLKMTGNGWVNSEILGNKLDFKNGDFTIDLWVRPSDTWRMCPICLPGNGLLIDLNNGIARIWFVNEDGQLVVHADGGGNGFGTIPVPANVWTHIAYVREGNYVALFVNGKLDIYVYIGSINKQYIPESSRIRLGNWDNGDSALYTYSGYIDEVRVTNKAMWHIFDNIPTEPYTK